MAVVCLTNPWVCRYRQSSDFVSYDISSNLVGSRNSLPLSNTLHIAHLRHIHMIRALLCLPGEKLYPLLSGLLNLSSHKHGFVCFVIQ